jgi:hypothetical protein
LEVNADIDVFKMPRLAKGFPIDVGFVSDDGRKMRQPHPIDAAICDSQQHNFETAQVMALDLC